ncbi:MAG: tryptophan--tRNA ligase [Oscillospiraceae bacterium]|nr:tryptophan--tRNA ligase [Oscillospiraceae bacterium]
MENQAPAKKKSVFSGIQPTGVFTLGNYLGAVKNWPQLQDDYRCTYCIVDMHAITVRQDPKQLRQRSLEAYALLLACGVDPQKSNVFIQSHVKTHAELAWVLNCNTSFGQLSRMTQFKDKSQKHPEDINAGLFDYPVLMAADILAYQADLVPVGIDQKQHLELARDIAQRFNTQYGNTFTIPEPYIPQATAKIMSLQEPTKKMSKSDTNVKSFISILDEKDTVIKKFRSAVTDSEACVRYAEGKDGINNLMTIYQAVAGKSFEEIEKDFEGKGYGDFKTAVGEAVADHLAPVRDKWKALMDDKDYLKQSYTDGAQRALAISQRTIDKVYKKVGFIPLG